MNPPRNRRHPGGWLPRPPAPGQDLLRAALGFDDNVILRRDLLGFIARQAIVRSASSCACARKRSR